MSVQRFEEFVKEKYDNPQAIHHYEISQTSGDSTVTINVGMNTTDYPSATAISNYQYEDKLQEKKRQIRLIGTRYIDDFVKEFERKMQEASNEVAKSDLQFVGEFLIEECKIVSTTGKTYDIVELVEEINVFENIYTASVSGDIVIKDTTNIIQNFPIIGEERLVLKLQTPQSTPEAETTIDYTQSPLIIYKINSQRGDGETAQVISLQFGSLEGFRNQTTRVSQSYSGQPNEIVRKDFKRYDLFKQ